jgi:hypothetical protein
VLAAIQNGKPQPLNDHARGDEKPFRQTWDARFSWTYGH